MPEPDENDIVLSDDTAENSWDGSDRTAWLISGLIGAFIIARSDRDLLSAVLWLLGSVIRGWQTLPRLINATRQWAMKCHFLVGVAIGWALIPGPLVGSLAGLLAPLIYDLPLTSFQCGLIGLFVGPIVAAVEGVVVAILFFGCFRIYLAIAGIPWEDVRSERH